ncbi:FUSC family protein [Eisenbergiella porci]|uniref:FUSC family protein n=1 Tax=Eisenbergiella porci TaxID=2652274 RepID=UPI003FA449E3
MKQSGISERIRSNFRHSTLSFIFIIAYVNIFPLIFGPENSIVAVIFTIMMSASMVRDLTATPVKHLFLQSAVLVWMGIAAFLVTTLPALFSFLINFFTLLLILYAFTYEYSNHIYFPYILSYLFLIFISPVHAGQLPMRILGMLAGALSIMLYQWVMGRKRVQETARDVLTEMIDDICQYISQRTAGNPQKPDLSAMRHKLCRLSRTVYERRKKTLCVSDAGFSMIDAGRGLEHLMILIQEFPETLSGQDKIFLSEIVRLLNQMRIFLQQEGHVLPSLETSLFYELKDDKTARLLYNSFVYIRDRLLHMTDPQSRTHYRKTALSLKVRLQAALDLSPVRAVYALRIALLLSCATLLVQLLALPHGKWLLFTLASVSLPYADDVPVKMKKRFLATVIGGLLSVVIYTFIPSSAGRTAVMMLSGYLSFYFTNYTETFACSTIGALGGAVFMSAFDFQAVGNIFLIRIGYIVAGIAVAYVINCLLFPYTRAMATRQLMKKYKGITELLTKVCHSEHVDTQLYYNLVIQAHLQEEKLTSNAHLEEWGELPALLAEYRAKVRQAHRGRIPERADAPVFESGHLAT